MIANVVVSTPGSRVPTKTILPSAWSAMPLAMSVAPRFSVCLPSPEKVVSSAPSGSYRARAKSRDVTPPLLNEWPPATIRPSGWTATPVATSLWPANAVVSLPSPEKLVSSVPFVL